MPIADRTGVIGAEGEPGEPVMRSRRKLATLLILALGAAACGGGSGGEGNSAAAEGDVCSPSGGPASCGSGLVCRTAAAAGIAICRQSCQSDSDCNAVFTQDRCAGGVCSCTPGPASSDPCAAVNPDDVCHPDFDVCVTAGAGACAVDAGEAAALYDGVQICRPTAAPDGGVGADGGVDSGVSGCGAADSQGICDWPEFCGGTAACLAPQNLDASGTDSPSPACQFPGGNADQVRQTPPGPSGPILMTLAQDTNQADCHEGRLSGPDPRNPSLCLGDGVFCGASDSVVVFQGTAYDPASAFATGEGGALDRQFFRVVEDSTLGAGQDMTATSSVATNQIGHVVPGSGWTANGGSFTLWRCFGASHVAGNVGAASGFVPAHYLQTTGNAGNTFCATWRL